MAGAPQAQQGGGGGGSDNSMGIIWTIVAIFAALCAIWFSLKTYIVRYYLGLKLLEIDFISLFTSGLDSTRDSINTTLDLLITSPDKVAFSSIVENGTAVGKYLLYPCVAIIALLAVAIYLTNTVRKYKRTYDMKSLLQFEQVNWPQVSPVSKLDLVKTDIDKGPWAMALTPMQFCKRNQLLQEYKKTGVEGLLSKERNRLEVSLIRGNANKLFAMQLGPLFATVDKLPPHTQALFAIFAARLNNDSQPAANYLKKLASGAANGKMDFSDTAALLKKHADTKLVKKAIEPHAYVLTMMAAILVAARTDGVQATADFLWLKPLDRRLWYMLNTVGRQTPFVEVAGPFAHWVAEKELGRKILVPMVEEATNALENALKDIIYTRDEEKE